MIVVDWDKGVVKKGSYDRILFRVPKWARELWDERSLKVICWMELGKPVWLDVDRIEVVDQEGVILL